MDASVASTSSNSDLPAKAANDSDVPPATEWSPKHEELFSTVNITVKKRSLLASPCSPDRNSLAAIHRVTGVKEETVTAWLKQIEPQMEQIEAVLLKDHKLSRAQLDALWTYVGHKGEKKVSRKKLPAAHAGAGRPSKPTRGYASGARSPKPRKKSPNI